MERNPIPEAKEATMTQTLVAIDFSEDADRRIDSVVDFIARHGGEGAFQGWTVKDTDEGRPRHEVRFDARKVRNTEVHGAGFRAGFIVHIES